MIKSSLLFAILIGAGGFTFYYGKGYSYLSDYPGACMNCLVIVNRGGGQLCTDCHKSVGHPMKYIYTRVAK